MTARLSSETFRTKGEVCVLGAPRPLPARYIPEKNMKKLIVHPSQQVRSSPTHSYPKFSRHQACFSPAFSYPKFLSFRFIHHRQQYPSFIHLPNYIQNLPPNIK